MTHYERTVLGLFAWIFIIMLGTSALLAWMVSCPPAARPSNHQEIQR